MCFLIATIADLMSTSKDIFWGHTHEDELSVSISLYLQTFESAYTQASTY